MNALKCRTLAKKMLLFERIHVSINKPSLKSIIIEQCVGVLPSPALIRT